MLPTHDILYDQLMNQHLPSVLLATEHGPESAPRGSTDRQIYSKFFDLTKKPRLGVVSFLWFAFVRTHQYVGGAEVSDQAAILPARPVLVARLGHTHPPALPLRVQHTALVQIPRQHLDAHAPVAARMGVVE